MSAELGFVHRFVPGRRPGAVPLLLLHGTGGSEDDLLSLGATLAPGAALLSPRGQVLENGMPRFFRRLAEGVFDLEDLRFRTSQLADFLVAARQEYGLGEVPPVALGFSNGANIAAALLLLHPGSLSGALLLRPMVPVVPDPLPALPPPPLPLPLPPPFVADVVGAALVVLVGAADVVGAALLLLVGTASEVGTTLVFSVEAADELGDVAPPLPPPELFPAADDVATAPPLFPAWAASVLPPPDDDRLAVALAEAPPPAPFAPADPVD